MKILVTGSRNHTDQKLIWDEISDHDPDHIVHGGARGADNLASKWAVQIPSIRVSIHKADWVAYGSAAGPIRNTRMLKLHPDIDLVLAFPLGESRGTWDMIDKALEAKINTKVVFR